MERSDPFFCLCSQNQFLLYMVNFLRPIQAVDLLKTEQAYAAVVEDDLTKISTYSIMYESELGSLELPASESEHFYSLLLQVRVHSGWYFQYALS